MVEWMVQKLKPSDSCKSNVFEHYESCFKAMILGQPSSVAHPLFARVALQKMPFT